tara:strand:- start:116 stop:418 length:303 start_codon:yes stop_codon:yes gene_type:complete
MDFTPTTITFSDVNKKAKNIRKSKGGMVIFDLMESYAKSDGKKGWKSAISSSMFSIMQWDNGTLAVKIFGREFRGFPVTIRPQATNGSDEPSSPPAEPEG